MKKFQGSGGSEGETSSKQKKTMNKSDAEKLILQFVIKRVVHKHLPEEIQSAVDLLKNCNDEPSTDNIKIPKKCNLSKVINPNGSHINVEPVEKQDNCSGTEHMTNDYIKIEIQKYENRKNKMHSKRTQTDKEGSQRNKEVTDRAFSDDFKCRSYTGMIEKDLNNF